MSQPERLNFKVSRPLTTLELDEKCALCGNPRRVHIMPDYRCTRSSETFEPTGRYEEAPEKLEQLRLLRKAERLGFTPLWRSIWGKNEDGKTAIVGFKIYNESEMRRVVAAGKRVRRSSA